jgi:predicted GIY-YIG superfamily endonuclease
MVQLVTGLTRHVEKRLPQFSTKKQQGFSKELTIDGIF